jgi:hypothetical protein
MKKELMLLLFTHDLGDRIHDCGPQNDGFSLREPYSWRMMRNRCKLSLVSEVTFYYDEHPFAEKLLK